MHWYAWKPAQKLGYLVSRRFNRLRQLGDGVTVRWTQHGFERAVQRMRFDDSVPYERIANKGKALQPSTRFVIGGKGKTKYVCKKGSHSTVLIMTVLDRLMAANKAQVRRSAAYDELRKLDK